MLRVTILFLIQLIGCLRSEVFSLFESYHADSETKCTHGYISNFDKIVFKSRINITASQGISTANFEIISSQGKSLRYICDIEIPTDCIVIEDGTSKCPCTKLDDKNFQLTLKVNASTRFNKANIIGNYYNSKQGSITKTVPIPEIYESSNVTGILVINDKLISPNVDGCVTHVNDLPLKVNFSCLSHVRPCLIDMVMHDTKSTVQRLQNITSLLVTKHEGTIDTMYLHINFAACRLEGKIKSVDCLIKTKEKETEAEQNVETEKVLYPILGIIIFILIMVLIGMLCKKRCPWKKCFCHPECLKRMKNKQFTHSVVDETFEVNDTCTDGSKNLLTSCPDESNDQPNKEAFQERDRKYSTTSTVANLKDDDEPYQENGDIEILNSNNGVLDFETQYDSCNNQEDHNNFIDVEDFDVQHLPNGFQDQKFKILIKVIADLTVLLTVYVGTDGESRRQIKIGNGFVGRVFLYKNELCSCRNCLNSKDPSTQYAIVVVYTSSHVVGSEREGLLTTCHLFYDNRDGQTFFLRDYMHGKIDDNQKKFKLDYITCNQDIITRLEQASKTWHDEYPKINRHYKNKYEKGKWVFIVSHVHGLHKRISIGNLIDNPEFPITSEKDKVTQYTYNASTCVGTTGAYVYLVSRDKGGWLTQHFHHGRLENGDKFCGKGVDYSG